MSTKRLRIHGDNIVECERTLDLLSQAFNVVPSLLPISSLYLPVYKLSIKNEILQIELLSGYSRYGVDITAELLKQGGILREGADSYITEIAGNTETILLALEYCSALPAGNNAWQRNGRAYSSVLAGVPYLYFAEIGGIELDTNRNKKAPRFPNPVVPFSYAITSRRMKNLCIPVYQSHSTITDELYEKYHHLFGLAESLQLIKGIIAKTDYSLPLAILKQKAVSLAELLANDRRSITTLKGTQWQELLKAHSTSQWLEKNSTDLIWQPKKSNKVQVSETFKTLFLETIGLQCFTACSKDLPICLIPTEKRNAFENLLKRLYPKISFAFSTQKHLAVVWITGFKPRGDDSRPDRGLTPLARMILGEDTDILVVVSGPAKPSTWNAFKQSPKQLAVDNGLWQAILHTADYVLIDSDTCTKKIFYKTETQRIENVHSVSFSFISQDIEFSEHDTDTAIHQIFSHKESAGIYECMCNPPGGDWSGVNFYEQNGNLYRWTSLPRVSPSKGKRPDHVIQLPNNVLLSIESKQLGQDLENNIGNNLKIYIRDLFKSPPTAYKTTKTDWRYFDEKNRWTNNCTILSSGAFTFTDENELLPIVQRCKIDIVLAFEFGGITTLHILANSNGQMLMPILKQITGNIQGLKIQVH